MMNQAIDIIEAKTINTQQFYQHYLAKQQPVLIKNAIEVEPLLQLVLTQPLKNYYGRGAVPFLYRYVDSPQLTQATFEQPLIAALVKHSTLKFRRFIRVWHHHKGNISHWHYDQRSTDIFNICLSGAKQWRLLPPEAPLRFWPFFNIALPLQQQTKQSALTITMQAGDMLYLPRHWLHQVTTLEYNTRNLNVLFNRFDNGTMQAREQQLAALRYHLIPHYIYGDNNPAINKTLHNTPWRQIVTQLVKELLILFLLLLPLLVVIFAVS